MKNKNILTIVIVFLIIASVITVSYVGTQFTFLPETKCLYMKSQSDDWVQKPCQNIDTYIRGEQAIGVIGLPEEGKPTKLVLSIPYFVATLNTGCKTQITQVSLLRADETTEPISFSGGVAESSKCGVVNFQADIPVGKHTIKVDYEFYDIRNQNKYYFEIFTIISVEPLPCVASAGQMLVMDVFVEGNAINKDALTLEPIKFCEIHSPLVWDQFSRTSWEDCRSVGHCDYILEKLRNDQTYIVPKMQEVAIYYLSYKPSYIYAVCKQGETWVAKDGICSDIGGIYIPCSKGVLQPDGGCLFQPEIIYVCDGQIEILPSGEQVCNIFLPIREKYKCGDKIFEDYDEAVAECEEIIEEEVTNIYYCEGVAYDTYEESKNACSHSAKIEYWCSDDDGNTWKIIDPNDCKENFKLERKYFCDGKEIDDPSKCDAKLDYEYECKEGWTLKNNKCVQEAEYITGDYKALKILGFMFIAFIVIVAIVSLLKKRGKK